MGIFLHNCVRMMTRSVIIGCDVFPHIYTQSIRHKNTIPKYKCVFFFIIFFYAYIILQYISILQFISYLFDTYSRIKNQYIISLIALLRHMCLGFIDGIFHLFLFRWERWNGVGQLYCVEHLTTNGLNFSPI